jgi:DNA-binding transcriptional MocR family regulator
MAQIGSAHAHQLTGSDVRALLRYAQDPHMISLAGGLPSADAFDVVGLEQALARAWRFHATPCLQYGMSEGQPRLREALAGLLAERGIRAQADDVLVTTGSQQALDLVARCHVEPGDKVVVERPTYLAALQVLRMNRAQVVGIDADAQGLDLDALEALDMSAPPRMVYVVSTFSNPSGATLSLERRRRLLAWAAKHQVLVLEDDPYGELRFRGASIPSLLSLAQSELPEALPWIAYTSTLSKCVAPGLRIGFLVAPAPLRELVLRFKQASDLHSPSFAQEVAAAYLQSGRLADHLHQIRSRYAQAQTTLADALHDVFGERLRITASDGGMFLWASFTDGTETRELLHKAIAQGVLFVPGDVFYSDRPSLSALRLNFTGAPIDRLRLGVQRLAAAAQPADQVRSRNSSALTAQLIKL